MTLAAITFGPDIEAFMGGLGVGLSCVFFALLFLAGAGIIRRILGA